MEILQFEFYPRITGDNYIQLDMITQQEVISNVQTQLCSDFFFAFLIYVRCWTEVSRSTKMFKCVGAKHWQKLVFIGRLDSRNYKYCTKIYLVIRLLLVSGKSVRVSSPVLEYIAVKTFPFHISLQSRKTVNNKRLSAKITYKDIVLIYKILL